MTDIHITAPDGSLWQLVPVEPTREMKLAGMAANDGIVSYLFRAMLDAAPEFPGEFELDYRRRQMKAVADYLTPNWSNDMEWSDEIIIAIEQRTAAPEFGEGDVDGELNRLADALSQSARMYNEGRTTMRCVANGALDVAQRLRQLAIAPVFGGVAVDLESLAIAVHRGAVDHAYWRHRSGMDVDYFASILAGVQHAYACGHLARPPAADEAMGRDAARYREFCRQAEERQFPTTLLDDAEEMGAGVLDMHFDAAMRGTAEKAGEG